MIFLYNFKIGKEWKTVSEEAKDLIQKILVAADSRISLAHIFDHPWMKKRAIDADLKIDYKRLEEYQNHTLLKKLMISYIVSQLNEESMIKEKELFLNIDNNCSGMLTYENIRRNLTNLGNVTEKEINEVIRGIDIDNNGIIEYSGFLN